MYKEMLDTYEKQRAEMKQNAASNLSPAVAYNQQLLAKYDGELNALTNEIAKYEDKPGDAQKSMDDMQKSMDKAVADAKKTQ
jgi:uncharacterized coiled-coil protein SlyX